MVWKKGNGVKETAIGNIIMAIALIVGVIFLGYSAVQNISSMFMEELAGRREQFVESKLEDLIKDEASKVLEITGDRDIAKQIAERFNVELRSKDINRAINNI